MRAGRSGSSAASGTLTYEVVQALTDAGMGQTTCLGIGGDPIVGTSFVDVLDMFNQDPETEAIVMIGEIGGEEEERAAAFVRARGAQADGGLHRRSHRPAGPPHGPRRGDHLRRSGHGGVEARRARGGRDPGRRFAVAHPAAAARRRRALSARQVTSLGPFGAGDNDQKAPVREPLHPDERDASRYAPRPPSERGSEPERQPGVGLFRMAGWGWGLSIALVLLVGLVIVIGILRDDPGRNPAPAAYRTAVCAAAAELSAGTDALERGVSSREDPAQREEAEAEIGEHISAAVSALEGLPEWVPGRSLDELLGAQIITLTNGAGALESGPAEEDLETAINVDAQMREQLCDGRYDFSCDA